MGMERLGSLNLSCQIPERPVYPAKRHVAKSAAVLVCLMAAACARPTGDFERARPSVIHDTVMPAAGEQAARYRGDPVSKFNYTNDEKLLRDRGWGLIRPPWTKDWIGGTAVELARTRIVPEVEGRVPTDLYYHFLSTDKFRSSDARFDRIASDAKGDAKLVWPFCEVALRVNLADQERLRALKNRPVTTEEIYEGAKARVWENRVMIKWVTQALHYRIKAYRTAVENLEIETPTENRVWRANRAIQQLKTEVKLAEAGCEETGRSGVAADPKRSRIYSGWGLEKPPPKK